MITRSREGRREAPASSGGFPPAGPGGEKPRMRRSGRPRAPPAPLPLRALSSGSSPRLGLGVARIGRSCGSRRESELRKLRAALRATAGCTCARSHRPPHCSGSHRRRQAGIPHFSPFWADCDHACASPASVWFPISCLFPWALFGTAVPPEGTSREPNAGNLCLLLGAAARAGVVVVVCRRIEQ